MRPPRLIFLFWLLIAVIFGSGCGPKKSNKQPRDRQSKEQSLDRKTLVGSWLMETHLQTDPDPKKVARFLFVLGDSGSLKMYLKVRNLYGPQWENVAGSWHVDGEVLRLTYQNPQNNMSFHPAILFGPNEIQWFFDEAGPTAALPPQVRWNRASDTVVREMTTDPRQVEAQKKQDSAEVKAEQNAQSAAPDIKEVAEIASRDMAVRFKPAVERTWATKAVE